MIRTYSSLIGVRHETQTNLKESLSIPVPKPGAALGSQRVARDESPIFGPDGPFDPAVLQTPSQGGTLSGFFPVDSFF
ncbi:hypothetical protein K439DRAFT_1032957 [Ramaria rubella]|nr:hypothetical protein K439DRAFT_1032957 [Ramaria rubella]